MKMIRKGLLGLSFVALAAGMMSCASKKSDAATEDTAITADSMEMASPHATDSLTAIFADPAKLSAVATDSTYAVTDSGLKYMIIREGKGESPKPTDNVTVNYRGQLIDGQVFDSSYDRGEPTTFPLNRVIPGWTEGLQLMKPGGEAVFYIPADLAYGPTGTPGGPIGPNEDLIFTVELISVN